MKLEVFTGKTEEEALQTALECFDTTIDKIIYETEIKKGGLFKGTSYEIKAIKLTTILEYLKQYLLELLNNMSIKATFETQIRNNQLYIKIYSDKNNVLIGKNGQNLQALQTIIRQLINKNLKNSINVILDVENYREKQLKHLEILAKKIAKEVQQTHQDVVMDNMNSYERRIVHNAIAKFKNISSVSEGIEPNRHIIISYKEK